MAIDTRGFLTSFSNEQLPAWPCPYCNRGILTFPERGVTSKETYASETDRENPNWEPDWMKGLFSVILRCSHCKEVTLASGRAYINEVEVEIENPGGFVHPELVEFFEPQFFSAPIPFFRIPKKCPEPVADEIKSSFQIAWLDSDAAGNRIRASIEKLLDYQRINKTRKKKSKRVRIILHDRIEIFGQKNPELKIRLLAIKWLGNTGSHSSRNLTRDDLLHAYAILEDILLELYVKSGKTISALAKKIVRKKGPVSGR